MELGSNIRSEQRDRELQDNRGLTGMKEVISKHSIVVILELHATARN